MAHAAGQDPLDEIAERYAMFRAIVEDNPVEILLGDALANAERTFRSYAALPEDVYPVLALWSAHTFFTNWHFITPYVSLHSATLREGKTRTMEVAGTLVRNPVLAANVSTAALYRLIDAERPTLFLDEQDASARVTEDYRRILNSGYKSNGFVFRSVNGVGTRFTTFCAKMFAGIGTMPDTIRDRSIEIRMRRALPEEQDRLYRFRERRVTEEMRDHRDLLQALSNRYGSQLADAEPTAPGSITNARLVEIWEPLWALADLAGSEWAERSRAACVALQRDEAKDELVALLRDCRAVFGMRDRVSSSEVLMFVDSRLGVYEGPPLRNAKALSMSLRKFEISPRQWRDGDERVRGYERADFEDAWRRYL
jgi:hypothetical protein